MLQKLYSWYGKKTVLAVFVTVLLLVIVGVVIKLQSGDVEIIAAELPIVKVSPVGMLASDADLTLIGSVRAVSEAEIKTESAGRITSVPVSLGQTVKASQIIATIENASQRAAVLQAEGAYEAALAAAQQGAVSVSSAQTDVTTAKTNVVSAYNTLFNTSNSILLITIDDFFSNPDYQRPGLYIDGKGKTAFLNDERVAFGDIMEQWQQTSQSLTSESDLQTSAEAAKVNALRLERLITTFIDLVNLQDRGTTINGAPVESYNSVLIADRSNLQNALTGLENSIDRLKNAEENLERAQIGGGTTVNSASAAQIKQALGALRATQANLEKTILRSPIAGTVNSLNVNIGDYVGAFTNVAKIANNNALEISTFVGENDLAQIKIGSKVLIEGAYPGVVTNIAAGIDDTTKKTEVKIATETDKLTSGDTVSIAVTVSPETRDDVPLLLPITAIKFSAENGSVFTVEDGSLVAHEVVIGAVRGSNVEIKSGVTNDMKIVVDARGLSAGAKVEAVE